jgi:two-component system, OmpR family, response regulator CpxR
MRRNEMPVISIFSGSFCRMEQVLQELVTRTGYTLIMDDDLVSDVHGFSGTPTNRIERVFTNKTSVFNKFTHEKERSISYLRLALAQKLSRDNLIFTGFSTQFIPVAMNHVLRVCLIADMKFRISEAAESRGLSSREATKLIHKQDEERASWVNGLRDVDDPWEPSLYDIIIPMDKTTVEEAASLIEENLGKDILQTTAASRKSVEDFLLAATVEAALVKQGHQLLVSAEDGDVTVTINKHVLALGKLEQEIKSIAEKMDGVKAVNTKVGKDFYQTDIYRKYDFEMPSRILLVDDEREFVTTLSERLLMRDMGSVVAYDGRSALDLIESDEPDVMILDLRMPGIDGIEVLRRVKKSNPNIEVIILTGHGSEEDRKVCMELGAFAYLQKPVDIDLLSETLKKANEKVRTGRQKP